MWVITWMSNIEVPNLAPPISSKGSHKSTGNQGKFFLDVIEISKHSQNSAKPNPICQKKKKKVDKTSLQTCTRNTSEQRREWAEMQEEEGG